MVKDRLRDGKRIAQLVASELTGDRDALRRLVVVDADPDIEPTADGTRAYRVVCVADEDALVVTDRGQTTIDSEIEDDPTEVATVFVQPERARIEFVVAPKRAADAAAETDLRVRRKAVDPPQTLVFVEDGAQAKQVTAVFRAAVETIEADEP